MKDVVPKGHHTGRSKHQSAMAKTEFVNSQRPRTCTKYASGRMFAHQYLCPTKTNTTKACTTRTTIKEESRGTKENYNKMEQRTATRRRRATKTTTTKNNNHHHHHHHRHQQAHKQRRQRRSPRRLIGKHNSGIKPPPTTRPSCGMRDVPLAGLNPFQRCSNKQR